MLLSRSRTSAVKDNDREKDCLLQPFTGSASMSRKPSKEEQAAIRAALDAALDDLDVDESDEELEEEVEGVVEEQAADDGSVDDDEEANADPSRIVVDGSKVEKEDAEISVVETSETLPDASANDRAPETGGRHEAKSASSNDGPPTPVVLDAKLAAAAVEEETNKVIAGEVMVNDPSSPDSQRLQSLAAVQNAPPCVVVNPPLPETATATSETPTPTATPVKKSAEEEEEEDRPFLGPPRPPPASAPKAPPSSSGGGSKKKKQHTSHHAHHHHHHTTDPDKLFMEMMEDMLLTEQEGVTGPDEMMMRLVQQLQDQLHDLEDEVEGDGSDNDDNDDAADEEEDELEQQPVTPDVAEPSVVVGPEPHAVTNEEPVKSPSSVKEAEAAPPTDVVVDALPVSPPPVSKVSKVGDTLPASFSVNPDPPQPTEPVGTKSTSQNPTKMSDTSDNNDTSQAKPRDPAKPKSSSSESKAASTSSQTSTTKRKKAPVRPQPPQKSSSSSSPPTGGDAQQDLDAAISQLIQGMAQQAAMADDGPDDPNDVANGNEEADLLNMLMKGLSGVQGDGAGGAADDDDFNADAMIDGMMEQLLSKVKCAWRLDYLGCRLRSLSDVKTHLLSLNFVW
jgi:Pex19 protein family